MGWKEKMARVSEAFDLPGGLLPGALRVTMSGSSQALIENHRGIIAFDDTMIVLRGEREQLSIQGHGLYLAAMSEDWLLICGKIGMAEWE